MFETDEYRQSPHLHGPSLYTYFVYTCLVSVVVPEIFKLIEVRSSENHYAEKVGVAASVTTQNGNRSMENIVSFARREQAADLCACYKFGW